MPRMLTGVSVASRVSISFAALFVNVTPRIDNGLAWPVASSHAIRVVNTRVLPLPAPARISADVCGSVTAASCSGLRLARRFKDGSHEDRTAAPSRSWQTSAGPKYRAVHERADRSVDAFAIIIGAADGPRYETHASARRDASGELGDDALVRALDPRRGAIRARVSWQDVRHRIWRRSRRRRFLP